jgi:nitrate/TMAO reductase-like tetraheme cytochrome c subunit
LALRPLFAVVVLAWVTSLGLVPTLASRGASTPAVPAVALHSPALVSSQQVPASTNDDCLMCHADAAGETSAVDGPRYLESVHGAMGFTCTTCHTDLEGKELPHETPLARVSCATCHEDAVTAYDSSVHAAAIRRDANSASATCVDCHTAHDIRATSDSASPTHALNLPTTCGTCHIDKIRTYRDTFHGKVTSLGFERVAKCSDCHGAHEVLPKSDARSMVSKERVLETCRTCHEAATDAFVEYDPHADRSDRERNPELYWASRLMHWLLIGVFGFFGVHTLLWLPRSVAERRRRKEPRA